MSVSLAYRLLVTKLSWLALLARSSSAKNAEMRARLGGARQARTRRQRGPSAICLWAPH